MKPETATARLVKLIDRADEAREEWKRAQARLRAGWKVTGEVAEALAPFRPNVFRPSAKHDRVAQREATLHVIKRILDDGLVFEPDHMKAGGLGLRLIDPQLERDVEDAALAARQTADERERFAAQHHDLLAQHQAAEHMARLRDALAGDDPNAVRDALAAIPPPPPSTPRNTMTTADLEPAAR